MKEGKSLFKGMPAFWYYNLNFFYFHKMKILLGWCSILQWFGQVATEF